MPLLIYIAGVPILAHVDKNNSGSEQHPIGWTTVCG